MSRLEELIVKDKGKNLEFKENAGPLHRIIRTVVAFANTGGGILVIGVRDGTKEVVGLSNILKEEVRLAKAIADSIEPPLTPSLQVANWRDRQLLIVRVPHSLGPYYVKSKGLEKGCFVRFGSTNRLADQGRIAEIGRWVGNHTFDELPRIDAEEEDLAQDKVKNTFAQVSKQVSAKTLRTLQLLSPAQEILHPTNGALLLFAKEIEAWFPDLVFRCVVFKGTSRSHPLHSENFRGTVIDLMESALQYIRSHTLAGHQIGKLKRTDVYHYPEWPLREAITNALLHADYAVKGSSLQVAIFDDRLEITNPGALPFGLNLEDALAGYSQLRNRVLGRVFQHLGLIEQWGSGLRRMIEGCLEYGLRSPKFEEAGHFFRVTLFRNQGRSVELQPWAKALLAFLRDHPSVTLHQAAELWSVSLPTARQRLQKLMEVGCIAELSLNKYDPKKRFVLR